MTSSLITTIVTAFLLINGVVTHDNKNSQLTNEDLYNLMELLNHGHQDGHNKKLDLRHSSYSDLFADTKNLKTTHPTTTVPLSLVHNPIVSHTHHHLTNDPHSHIQHQNHDLLARRVDDNENNSLSTSTPISESELVSQLSQFNSLLSSLTDNSSATQTTTSTTTTTNPIPPSSQPPPTLLTHFLQAHDISNSDKSSNIPNSQSLAILNSLFGQIPPPPSPSAQIQNHLIDEEQQIKNGIHTSTTASTSASEMEIIKHLLGQMASGGGNPLLTTSLSQPKHTSGTAGAPSNEEMLKSLLLSQLFSLPINTGSQANNPLQAHLTSHPQIPETQTTLNKNSDLESLKSLLGQIASGTIPTNPTTTNIQPFIPLPVNPHLENFKNTNTNLDPAASNQLSGLLTLLGTLGSITQQPQSNSIFNFGQQPQKQQPSFLTSLFQPNTATTPTGHNANSGVGNLFSGFQQQPQQQTSSSTLSNLGSILSPGLSSIFNTMANVLGSGNSGSSGKPRVRGKGVDTRVGLGYRLGDAADAQLVFDIGPQLFTQPIANEVRSGISPHKRRVISVDAKQEKLMQERLVNIQHQQNLYNLQNNRRNDLLSSGSGGGGGGGRGIDHQLLLHQLVQRHKLLTSKPPPSNLFQVQHNLQKSFETQQLNNNLLRRMSTNVEDDETINPVELIQILRNKNIMKRNSNTPPYFVNRRSDTDIMNHYNNHNKLIRNFNPYRNNNNNNNNNNHRPPYLNKNYHYLSDRFYARNRQFHHDGV